MHTINIMTEDEIQNKVRSITAGFITKYSPGLRVEFLLDHVLNQAGACQDWIARMVTFYAGTGRKDVANKLQELQILARTYGL